MKHRMAAFTVCLSLAVLGTTACGDDVDYTEAEAYWMQPDTTIIGLGQPSDVKALSRDNVWVADLAAATIFSLTPPTATYVGIGMGTMEPTEVKLPAKIAVAPDIGLAAFDAETRRVDLFTLSGDYVRGFEPGFIPALMTFSREPLGFTFGVAPEDSAGVRHAVVIRTNMRGGDPDTLLSAEHGPEALRTAVASPGTTAMAPSRTGVWVWSGAARDTVFGLSPRATRRLVLRDVDTTAVGMMSDPVRQMLWMVHSDSTKAGMTYAAYDTRLAIEEGSRPAGNVSEAAEPAGDASEAPEPAADSASAFLGIRTTEWNFQPVVVYDGIVMGFRRVGAGIAMSAYDLNADEFERVQLEEDDSR